VSGGPSDATNSGASPLEGLNAWLAERSAALPPLPNTILAAIEQRGPEWWETPPHDSLAADPTDAALSAGESGTLDHFLLIGRSGRGYASYFFHVVVAEGPLVVVARVGAPTAFDDQLADSELGGTLHAIGPLAEAAAAARGRGAIGEGSRIVVLYDDRSESYRYGTVCDGVTDWHSASPEMLFEEATAAVSAL